MDSSLTPRTKEEKRASAKYFEGLSETQREQFEEAAARKARNKSGYGNGVADNDQRLTDYQTELRDAMLRKLQEIDAFSADVQAILFSTVAKEKLTPENLDIVLNIGRKLSTLTPIDFREYVSRVTATTSDWHEMESAIDQFREELKARQANATKRGKFETQLYGMEALYERYRLYLQMQKDNLNRSAMPVSSSSDGSGSMSGASEALEGIGTQWVIDDFRNKLDADLQRAGFTHGIDDFKKAVNGYITTFEEETRTIANVMLDQYEHKLMVEERRYQDLGEAAALYQAIGETSARTDFLLAETIRREHASSMMFSDDDMMEQAGWLDLRNAAIHRAEESVRTAASGHDLVSEDGFDLQPLATSSAKEIQSILLRYIRDRKVDIETTRTNLRENPEMIYGLNNLLSASFEAQNIVKGTLAEKIITDHINDIHWSEVIPKIVLAIIAIAAGIFSGGSGTFGVLAAGAAFGISAYQAIEEFKRYEVKHSAFGAKLTSEDPSMAWVIVAVVGAGIDAGVLFSVLPRLRIALEAFNSGAEAGDIAALTKSLKALQEDGIPAEIIDSILKSAEAQAQASAAWKAAWQPGHLFSFALPIPPQLRELGRAIYFAAWRGIHGFEKFVYSKEFVELVGDVNRLSPEQLAIMKAAYSEAFDEIEIIAYHGKSLGMVDEDIRAFINLRSRAEGMTIEELKGQMSAWKNTKDSGVPFGFNSAEQFQRFQSTATKELQKLLKKTDPNALAFLQGSAVDGTSMKRLVPFDKDSDFDVAIVSRYLFKKAEKLGLEVKLSPRRILIDKPVNFDKLDLDRFVNRLGDVVAEEGGTGTRKINIMLFENVEAMKKPLGEASRQTERSAVPLTIKK